MIYCSNLCTEIAQNMQEVESVSTEIKTKDGESIVVTTTKPGDFVVCNLASLSLGHLPVDDKEYMKDIIETAIRALDNVIDLNFYPVPLSLIHIWYKLPSGMWIIMAGGIRRMTEVIQRIHGNQLMENGIILMRTDIY